MNAMLGRIDIMPSFIELVGSKVPEGIGGKSFSNVLLGKKIDH